MPRVDEHAGDRFGTEPPDLLVRRDQGDDEQAVRPMGVGEQTECPLLAIRRLDVVEREVVRRRCERGHDAADALDRRGLRQERQYYADHERAFQREVLGDRARAVLERADRLEHPLPCSRGDVPAVVDDAGDRRDPDARPRGDVRDPRCRFGNRFHAGNFLPVLTSKVKGGFLDFPRDNVILSPPMSLKALSNQRTRCDPCRADRPIRRPTRTPFSTARRRNSAVNGHRKPRIARSRAAIALAMVVALAVTAGTALGSRQSGKASTITALIGSSGPARRSPSTTPPRRLPSRPASS